MWTRSLTQPDLKMMNQHDFQSICQLALSQLNVRPTTSPAPNFLFSGLNQQPQQPLSAPEELHTPSLPAPPPLLVISPASSSSPTATSTAGVSTSIRSRTEYAAECVRGVEFEQLASTPSPAPHPTSRSVKEEGQTEKASVGMNLIPTVSPPKPARLVHLLRCPVCSLESINKVRFDAHLPCSQNLPEKNYLLYSCSLCLACSTSHFLMEEHLELFHPGCSLPIEMQYLNDDDDDDDDGGGGGGGGVGGAI
ncbi:unnamed protein product [Schistocephalus solidus]|uniref:Nanos-type domain-containing protein n=1 Tax=Schistocephalus solidus TaxID=70667 RepID=A0A183SHE7_SCHSO|nr:unnamed protein product [Schistocephalus solidus]